MCAPVECRGLKMVGSNYPIFDDNGHDTQMDNYRRTFEHYCSCFKYIPTVVSRNILCWVLTLGDELEHDERMRELFTTLLATITVVRKTM